MRLENKIALVTGGGQGIGKEIAKTLALNGAFVLINYIDLGNNQEIAQMTKNEIESLGGKCEILPANVASYDETLEMFKTIKNEYGRLDILINNAGITKDGLMLRMKENDFDAVIDVNLKGTWNCMKHATKLMMKQKYGRIINISSVGGIQAGPAQVSYFAAKGGVVNLTKAMAGDLAPYGILVNAIAPCVYDTEMTHDALDAPGSLVLKNRVALKRFGREGEMNGALIYFASDACTYTTGQLLVIDGGMTSML